MSGVPCPNGPPPHHLPPLPSCPVRRAPKGRAKAARMTRYARAFHAAFLVAQEAVMPLGRRRVEHEGLTGLINNGVGGRLHTRRNRPLDSVHVVRVYIGPHDINELGCAAPAAGRTPDGMQNVLTEFGVRFLRKGLDKVVGPRLPLWVSRLTGGPIRTGLTTNRNHPRETGRSRPVASPPSRSTGCR